MSETDPPARPARLPRERGQSSTPASPKPSGARASAQPRGMSNGMKVVLAATFVVGAGAFALAKCGPGTKKAARTQTRWNAPPKTPRLAQVEDLLGQATERARRVVPDAALARMSGRQLDATGTVDLDYGGASFEFVAPPGAAPTTSCGVEEGIAWQGWQQRLRGACDATGFTPRCSFAAALAKAFPEPPTSVQFVLEVGTDGVQAWTFWPLEPAGPVVTLADDC